MKVGPSGVLRSGSVTTSASRSGSFAAGTQRGTTAIYIETLTTPRKHSVAWVADPAFLYALCLTCAMRRELGQAPIHNNCPAAQPAQLAPPVPARSSATPIGENKRVSHID